MAPVIIVCRHVPALYVAARLGSAVVAMSIRQILPIGKPVSRMKFRAEILRVNSDFRTPKILWTADPHTQRALENAGETFSEKFFRDSQAPWMLWAEPLHA